MKKWLPLLFLCCVISSYAWNSNGHRLVAQIAYDQLSKDEQAKFNQINEQFRGRQLSFINAAAWADKIRMSGNKHYDSWHYVDLNIQSKNIATHNVIWAINFNKQALADPKSSRSRKAFSLRMLTHLVGDIHQPLHCITRYDAKFPRSDYGGNLYFIKINGETISLHRYWDDEVGMLGSHYLSNKAISHIAKQLEQNYPQSYFSNFLQQTDPNDWARHSYQLAQSLAYTVPPYATPSSAYQQQAKRVVAQQITLAGYRLAQLLQQ